MLSLNHFRNEIVSPLSFPSPNVHPLGYTMEGHMERTLDGFNSTQEGFGSCYYRPYGKKLDKLKNNGFSWTQRTEFARLSPQNVEKT